MKGHSLSEIENYSLGMKMSTRVVDYQLKGRVEKRNPKISIRRKEFSDKEIADFTNCEDDAIPEVEMKI